MNDIADIRVNTQVPFPAMVTGSGPVTLGKSNGVWQVGFTIAAFGSQNPPIGNYPTDYVLAWDDVNKIFFKISLSNIVSVVQGARSQRLATASPIVVAGTDQIINVSIAAGAPACALPAASTRIGIPLTFKDVGGNFAAHNLTITPAGGDTIDGLASIVLAVNRQSVTLVPANDGTSTGWMIE
jgi:hypothetical protein